MLGETFEEYRYLDFGKLMCNSCLDLNIVCYILVNEPKQKVFMTCIL